MDCAKFETKLAELLAGDASGAGADELRQSLLAHAEACPACAGCRSLLEVAAGPHEERDPVPDPGARYWETFNERVSERIADSVAGSIGVGEVRPSASRTHWRWLVAAALVGLVLIAGLALRGTEQTSLATVETPEALPWDPPAPVVGGGDLEDRLHAAGFESLEQFVDGLGAEPVSEDDWTLMPAGTPTEWFPDSKTLDGDSREALLEWLRDEETQA